MTSYTLFYHPQHADNNRTRRLLKMKNIKFKVSDVTHNGISSYIFKDMGISELPALCIFSGYKYKLYEGFEEIEDFVAKESK